MKSSFRPSSIHDRQRITDFLANVFHSKPGDPVTDPVHMEWKYWRKRTAWEGSRSYLLERDGKVIAHGAAWPLRICSSAQATSAMYLIDWAAHPDFPGAGVSLMKHMASLVKVLCAVGGTAMTRRILPVFGFRPANEVRYFAKPLRPLAQILSHQARNWKLPVRLLRNVYWRYLPPIRTQIGWSAIPLSPEEIPAARILWPVPNGRLLVFERTAALFRYLSACRIASSEFYGVTNHGAPAGYFCLVFVPGQARIVDTWVDSPSWNDWAHVYQLATVQALQHEDVCEIVTASAIDLGQRALLACGFRQRGQNRLMLYDPQRQLEPDALFHFQMLDSDTAFLHPGHPIYTT
jgi:hypothetical protein